MRDELGERSRLVYVQVLAAPKEGNKDSEYEDAVAVSGSGLVTSSSLIPHPSSLPLTVAVSDGASAAVFARHWAERLCEAFADEEFPATDAEVYERVALLGKLWREQVAGENLPWYAEEKLPHGSAATLLVVSFDASEGKWQAAAAGDVCLFFVRGDKLKYSFPVTRARDFSDRPALFSTELAAPNGPAPPPLKRFGAEWLPGDRVFLMTDAASQWFLAEWEAKKKPWNDLPPSAEALPAWLKERRDNGKLKNDDVTIVQIAENDQER